MMSMKTNAGRLPVPPPRAPEASAARLDEADLEVPAFLSAKGRAPMTASDQAAAVAKMGRKGVTPAPDEAGKPALDGPDLRPTSSVSKTPEEGKTMTTKTTGSKARTAVKAKTAAKGSWKPGSIGAVAREAILAGKGNEDVLKLVMRKFPSCESNMNCVRWYRGDLQRRGLLKAGAKPAKGAGDAKRRPTKAA